MAWNNHDNVIAIDAGTGFVKCVSAHMRVLFPSIYGTRKLTRWEDPKEGIVEAVGYDAVKMSIHPDAVLVRTVLEGRVADEKAYGAIIKEAARKLGCEHDLGSILVMMGLPYGAATQKQTLEKLVQRTLRPARVLVIPQSIGTLLAEDAKTGLVMSIGQGTTELVLFEDLKYVEGISIPQACDYLYDGLDYLEYENKTAEKRRLDNLSTILANELAVFKTRLLREYVLYVSGGGVLVPGFCAALQKKIPRFKVAKDPVYSNAQGLYNLGTMISSSSEGHQERSHVP